uniref:Rad26/CSB-like winged helix DNA-binding domain-containing protein n=1 Tax=Globodera rostochiensis TaxID=31243 RepID=A0A914HXM8_GLORO
MEGNCRTVEGLSYQREGSLSVQCSSSSASRRGGRPTATTSKGLRAVQPQNLLRTSDHRLREDRPATLYLSMPFCMADPKLEMRMTKSSSRAGHFGLLPILLETVFGDEEFVVSNSTDESDYSLEAYDRCKIRQERPFRRAATNKSTTRRKRTERKLSKLFCYLLGPSAQFRPKDKYEKLADGICNFLTVNNGRANTNEILTRFQNRVHLSESFVFRSILKHLCKLLPNSQWILRDESV